MMKPTRSVDPRLGVDIGRVIISAGTPESGEDTFLTSKSDHEAMSTPPYPGMFDAMVLLSTIFHSNIWLVSKAGPIMRNKTIRWLHSHRFFDRTGIHPNRVYFCERREEKARICAVLGITHFIDDRLDVLEHMEGVVRYRYLFGPQIHSADAIKGIRRLASWADVRPSAFPMR